ncbi:MAG: hypothetical protein ACKV19_28100 [Verrucomicrobiales bacterium]
MKVGQTVHIPVEVMRVDVSTYSDWLELRLTDAHGVERLFTEKAPIVTCEDGPDYRNASLAGLIVEELAAIQGRSIVAVDTEKPWGIESTCDTKRFEVFADALFIEP